MGPVHSTGARDRPPRRACARALRLLVLALAALVASDAAPLASPRDARNGPDPRGSEHDREYQLKAAVVYHFIRYTTWPKEAFDAPDAPFKVLVVGVDPYGKVLDDALAGKVVHDRKLAVERRIALPPEIDAQVVLCGKMAPEDLALLLLRCKRKPVLLVGETQDFARSGGSARLLVEDDKIRFEVNVDAVQESRLTISSQVLKLARIVRNGEKK